MGLKVGLSGLILLAQLLQIPRSPPVSSHVQSFGLKQNKRRNTHSDRWRVAIVSGCFGYWIKLKKMDIVSQLQEQVNQIAGIAFNAFGTLHSDAPPVRLSSNYPQPPANPSEDAANFQEQPKVISAALVKAAKQFDALLAALPLGEGGEEAQLKRTVELQAENDAVGQELYRQLEAAEKELKNVQELFSQAADNCLNLKKPN